MSSRPDTRAEAFRLLPSIEELLHDPRLEPLARELAREVWLAFLRELIERWRGEIKAGTLDASSLSARLEGTALASELRTRVEREHRAGIVRVVNATGVVLHTGLGRAPV
ncbi:MAG: hypothetical protein HUU28_08815, partial [Planctomycetaceae bacterium]|nr:hypothetical protein [Planctomycetaceae bacterium]